MVSLACLLAASFALVRTLPAQNVAFIILALVAVEVAVESWHGNDDLFITAMFWPGAFIFSRMLGQIIFNPWRRARKYGFILIGVVSGILALAACALNSPKAAPARFVITALCLFFLTPWFLQKRVTFSGVSKK